MNTFEKSEIQELLVRYRPLLISAIESLIEDQEKYIAQNESIEAMAIAYLRNNIKDEIINEIITKLNSKYGDN